MSAESFIQNVHEELYAYCGRVFVGAATVRKGT